jgi:hypothetical protein
MRPKAVVAFTAALAGVVSAAVVGGLALAGGSTSSALPTPRFDHISNAGTPVANVSAHDADTLTSSGAKASLSLLAERGGTAFYSAPADTGAVCYGSGSATTGHLAVLECPHAADTASFDFPSKDRPILDMSASVFNADTRTTSVVELSGFAADGVASVGIIDENGVVHSAKVIDNVYQFDLPRVATKALIAIDSNGNEIFRQTPGQTAG